MTFRTKSAGNRYDEDTHIFTTFDGTRLVIDNRNQRLFVMSYGNFGSPPIQYLVRKGYKQDGDTVVDYTLDVRSVPISFHRSAECTRKNYWTARAALIDLMRPNRGGGLT